MFSTIAKAPAPLTRTSSSGPDAAGKYDGNIYVAYDHGRGKTPPNYEKEITIAVIPEKSIVEGKPVSTRFIVSK
jgi:hypothetical protein